jgi:hypothetical protein
MKSKIVAFCCRIDGKDFKRRWFKFLPFANFAVKIRPLITAKPINKDFTKHVIESNLSASGAKRKMTCRCIALKMCDLQNTSSIPITGMEKE